jgi:hypothetical protein
LIIHESFTKKRGCAGRASRLPDGNKLQAASPCLATSKHHDAAANDDLRNLTAFAVVSLAGRSYHSRAWRGAPADCYFERTIKRLVF